MGIIIPAIIILIVFVIGWAVLDKIPIPVPYAVWKWILYVLWGLVIIILLLNLIGVHLP